MASRPARNEELTLSKRGRDRVLVWLGGLVLVVGLAIAGVALWMQVRHSPPPIQLHYGELVQALRASSRAGGGVTFHKVQVSHADVRGEVVTTDRVSTGGE